MDSQVDWNRKQPSSTFLGQRAGIRNSTQPARITVTKNTKVGAAYEQAIWTYLHKLIGLSVWLVV